MNLPTFTPATRARLMLSMNEALGLPDEDTTSQASAFVSAVTQSESPGTILLLAECVEDLIDRLISADVRHVIVDPSALFGRYDAHTIATAMKLAGCTASPRSGGNVWATCAAPMAALPCLVISGDVLESWIKND
ncbi:MAG: hypothetical protein ABJJ03_17320 [Sulfitobacter sp.]